MLQITGKLNFTGPKAQLAMDLLGDVPGDSKHLSGKNLAEVDKEERQVVT